MKKSYVVCVCMIVIIAFFEAAGAFASSEELTISVFPRRNAQQTKRMFTPLVKFLSQKINKQVTLIVSKDFDSFWEGVKNLQYDIVHFNQYHYVRSHKEYGYRVILKNEEFGFDTISGSLVTRKDSNIHFVSDLKGKKIVFGGGPKAMQSYIIATYLLHEAGLHRGDYIEAFAKNPPNAVYAAYFGQSAASGVGEVVLKLPAVTDRIDTSKLTFLARGPQLPHLAWAVSSRMSDELAKTIQFELSNLKNHTSGKNILDKAALTGLNIAQDQEYDRHRQIIWEVKQENYCQKQCGDKSTHLNDHSLNTPFLIGIFPRRPKNATIENFTPLVKYLSGKLGREVQLIVEKDFHKFWQGVIAQKYDLVHYNQYHYVKSHKMYDYHIILKNEEFGRSTITPAILVRNDSPIRNLNDIKGKKIAFGGGKMAMVSYIANTYLIRQSGLLQDKDYEIHYALNPQHACKVVLLNQADACGTATVLLEHQSNVANYKNELRVIATSEPLPQLVWAVKSGMREDMRNNLTDLLARLKNDIDNKSVLASAQLTGFVPAYDQEYNLSRKYIYTITGEKY